MRCVVDRYIPFLNGRLEQVFDSVEYLDPADITHDRLLEVDVLLIRTRTRCNSALLDGTKVRFIATATIGMDHIDLSYCQQKGIYVVNAPGCNARGVAQYVESAITHLGYAISGLTIGIIGVGHVGRLVESMAHRLGLTPLIYDPPRQRAEGGNRWTTDLSDIARKADIVTFHTPLTHSETDATANLGNQDFFALCKPKALIINAARGGIVDEQALLRAENREKKIVIDTWYGEPKINLELLARADIATPHIAGYSEEGKRNATRMIINELSTYLGVEIDTSDLHVGTEPLPTYDIWRDHEMLLNTPTDFEALRQNYKLR